MWVVYADRPRRNILNGMLWDFRSDFFPRYIHYKRDALRIADEAMRKGGVGVRVEKYQPPARQRRRP